MQIITEQTPPFPLVATEIDFDSFEPRRVVISPFELCLLSEPDDLFEDE